MDSGCCVNQMVLFSDELKAMSNELKSGFNHDGAKKSAKMMGDVSGIGVLE